MVQPPSECFRISAAAATDLRGPLSSSVPFDLSTAENEKFNRFVFFRPNLCLDAIKARGADAFVFRLVAAFTELPHSLVWFGLTFKCVEDEDRIFFQHFFLWDCAD